MKSPPELWAACSDPAVLGRHLEPFGEIRITRLEPESTVAWEGDRASGTVQIEPAGWGTKVTLTALGEPPAPAAPDASPASAAPEVPAPEAPEARALEAPQAHAPEAARAPVTPHRRRGGLFGWLLGRREKPATRPAPPAPGSAPRSPAARSTETPKPDTSPAPEARDPAATLLAALDSLGQAHHRPYSRG